MSPQHPTGVLSYCKVRKLLYLFLVLADLTFPSLRVSAITAAPDPVTFRQGDGSLVTLWLKGDERLRWAESTDGFTLLPGPDGSYYYAISDRDGNLVPSSFPARDPGQRSQRENLWLSTIPKGLWFNHSQASALISRGNRLPDSDAPMMGGFPATGTRKYLLILANFSNTTATYGPSAFQGFMNDPGYNGTGSFRDYFLEVSYGQLTVNTTVTAWVTLPNPHDYYGPQDKWGQFAFDAVNAAVTAGINLAEFDNNADGIVDGIAIIHQGQGQEETGNINDIWSHSWDLSSAGFSVAQRTFGNISVNAYTTMPERNATGMGTIGVVCHEFGHNLGAPDFYDTDYSIGGAYLGTGKWDLMAGGSWNGVAGTKPAHPNAWIKAMFGWTTPVTLSSVQNVTLRSATFFPDVIRFNTATPNEYYLCENRQMTGFDAGIPGHGLIIYHVDGDHVAASFATNSINTSLHQGLYPVCAGAGGNTPSTYGTINWTGCPYPGSQSKTSFTDATTPWSKSWAGASTNLPVTNIYEYLPAQEISFCFVNCYTLADPLNFTATPASTSTIALAWAANSAGDPVMVAWNTCPTFGAPADSTSYSPGSPIQGGGTVLFTGTASTFQHTGLQPSTHYYYKAWSALPGQTYSPGVTGRAATLCGTVSSFPWTEGFEYGGAAPGCWTQEQINNSGLCWNFPTGNGFGNPATARSGSSNACLKDKTAADNRTRLVTPALDLTSLTNPRLSFWHTQPAWGSDQDILKIYYKTSSGGTWILLATYSANIPVWTQETLALPASGPTYYIAFEGNAKFGHGICIDDVEIANACTSYTTVAINISVSMNPVAPGTQVTGSATVSNGGCSPSYQWKIGGVSVPGATNCTFSTIPSDNDEITCVLISSENCVTNNPAVSNPVVMDVTGLPVSMTIGNMTLPGSQCFNALDSITVAGSGSTFTVEPGGNATLIAGNRIRLLPGTFVQAGGYLQARITTDGTYCGTQSPVLPPEAGQDELPARESRNDEPQFTLYPNPTCDQAGLLMPGSLAGEAAEICILDLSGHVIDTRHVQPSAMHRLDVSTLSPGLFIVTVRTASGSGSAKLIRRCP